MFFGYYGFYGNYVNYSFNGNYGNYGNYGNCGYYGNFGYVKKSWIVELWKWEFKKINKKLFNKKYPASLDCLVMNEKLFY